MTFELLSTRQFSVVLGYTSYTRSPNDERKSRCVQIVLFVKSLLITGRLSVRKDKGENVVNYFYQSVKTPKIYPIVSAKETKLNEQTRTVLLNRTHST